MLEGTCSRACALYEASKAIQTCVDSRCGTMNISTALLVVTIKNASVFL